MNKKAAIASYILIALGVIALAWVAIGHKPKCQDNPAFYLKGTAVECSK